MPDVLALVPARGGSRGVPRKNLRLLQGHPLVAWAIAAGRQARAVTRTLCSTDDPEIAAAAREYGAEVPFLRPRNLAGDATPDLAVFEHALDWLAREQGWRPETVVQLRPTSPIRPPGLVDSALQMLESDPAATSVRSVCPAPCNPYKMWRLEDEGRVPRTYMSALLGTSVVPEPYNAPRQSLPPVWWQTGAIDVVRSQVIRSGSMSGGNVLPLRIDASMAVDVDAEPDLERAERLITTLECVRPGPLPDWSQIRILATDVDGTLTPGSIYYGADGEMAKRFHTHDGKGIALVRQAGLHVAIITQEGPRLISSRAAKLGIDDVWTDVADKLAALRQVCSRRAATLREVAYVGDDVGDAEVMRTLAAAGGIPCAVADARPEARAAARFVCVHRGGEGAVRDVCDRILAARARRP